MTGGGFVGGEGRFANLPLPEGDKAAPILAGPTTD